MGDTYLLDAMMIGRLIDDRPDDEVPEGTRNFRKHSAAAGDPNIVICSITLGEVEYGLAVAPASFGDDNKAEVRRVLRRFVHVLEVSKNAAVPHWAETRARLFLKRSPGSERQRRRLARWPEDLVERTPAKQLGIQENDLWLASVALEHNLVLVSADRMRHIKDVCPDLKWENWLRP